MKSKVTKCNKKGRSTHIFLINDTRVVYSTPDQSRSVDFQVVTSKENAPINETTNSFLKWFLLVATGLR